MAGRPAGNRAGGLGHLVGDIHLRYYRWDWLRIDEYHRGLACARLACHARRLERPGCAGRCYVSSRPGVPWRCGKFCRQREQTVTDKEQALADAMKAVESAADPQTEAARRVVAWVSFGALHPTTDDFAMLRLVLLALLPQIGGMLLLIGRRSQTTGERRHSRLSEGNRAGWARSIREV